MAVSLSPIDDQSVAAFAAGLRGSVVRPDDDEYDEARQVWNGMIDRRPALIVRCAGVSDVIDTVEFAQAEDRPLSIRGGGHNIAGSAVSDGGIVLDCGAMDSVVVDPHTQVARVEPGATLADVDHETQAFGLATPLGINSTTGVAGLTLGGGFGWLTRKYGLAIDNLRSADVVTADGQLVHASADEHPDLFWAIRGGGGNFGVVTNFEFDCYHVGPEVLCGPLVYDQEDAGDVLRTVRAFNRDSPDACVVWAIMRKAPPLPFLDASVHGTDVLILVAFYAGEIATGRRVLDPIRSYGDPVADAIGVEPYAEFQQAFDPLLEPGARNYWKSHNFTELTDEAIDTAIEYAADLPTDLSEIFFGQLGGAMTRVDRDATAFPHRDTRYAMNVHTRWEDPGMDEECVAWAREFHEAMAAHATGGVYVNFVSEREGQESAAYGENYARLAALKAAYDPDNLFHVNQNVEPAREAE